MRAAAIVVAGGTGSRFGREEGKQTVSAGGRPLLAWAVAAVAGSQEIDEIVVVAPADRAEEYGAIAAKAAGRAVAMAPSGRTRQDSVWSGILALERGPDVIVVHDGARPLATTELVTGILGRLASEPGIDGVIVAHPSVDTVKVVDGDRVLETPERASLWAVQTPQAFLAPVLRDAYERAARDGYNGTDDASLVEHAGGTVVVYAGPRDNIKVTCPEDLVCADAALRARVEGAG